MSTDQAPDAHPFVTWITRPLATWLRVPVWGALAAVLLWLLLVSHSAAVQDARVAQALDDARAFLKGSKAFHGLIAAYGQREIAALRAASAATALLGRQTQAGVDLRRRADSLREASLANAKGPWDSVRVLVRVVDTLHASNDSLGRALVSGVQAIDSLGSAVKLADLARDAAVRRADSTQARLRQLIRAESCKMLGFLPCISRLHLGPYVGYQVVPKPTASLGLALVWSP